MRKFLKEVEKAGKSINLYFYISGSDRVGKDMQHAKTHSTKAYLSAHVLCYSFEKSDDISELFEQTSETGKSMILGFLP